MNRIVKGSTEALKWTIEFRFQRNLGSISQAFYNFNLYRKLNNSCDFRQIDIMQLNINKLGFQRGLEQTVIDLTTELANKEYKKELYIRDQLTASKTNFKDIEIAISEGQRWVNLTQEEKKLKNAVWSGPGELPFEISYKQPRIYEYTDSFEVTSIIFDKIYGLYTATVFSPFREQPNGKLNVQSIRSKTYSDIQIKLGQLVDIERNAYSGYKGNLSTMERGFKGNNRDKIDISKVEKFMGLNEKQKKERGLFNNDDLDGDIF